ncbi:MAG: LysM peptidoglycan-binding domain-containing protein [Woeseiaceae bacterium]|nr:LysM peptidoglycan-binding domain-containing protein [Woeseiaceae bacterium]
MSRAPIDSDVHYRVQPGDTLSGIASRIENRPTGLWSAVEKIFDANPDAFINNDMNRLKAGSQLTIPDFGRGAATVASETAFRQEPAAQTAATKVPAPATTTPAAIDDTRFLEPASTSPATDTLPGDLILDEENPFVDIEVPEIEAVVDEPIVGIADTQLESPTTAASPNVPSASIAAVSVPENTPATKTNWLLWMIGGGVLLLAGLLLFGRRARDYADPEPMEPEADHPMRRASDSMTVEAVADPDYDLDDDSPTAENLALDADLVVGTGLEDGTEIDVHQDFGFAATTELDLELPEDQNAADLDTDMMIAPTVDELAILDVADDSNDSDDDDYDMSVIVDATKVPRPEDASEYDLKAVKIEDDTDGDTSPTDAYTVDQEVDYKILEQDYEDELTATQALNKEIEKAAAELVLNRKDADNDEMTAEMALASVTEIDATANLPADFQYVSNIDDTGVNADITQEMTADEKTVEMPKSGNDDTVEMPSKSRKADSKAG